MRPPATPRQTLKILAGVIAAAFAIAAIVFGVSYLLALPPYVPMFITSSLLLIGAFLIRRRQ